MNCRYCKEDTLVLSMANEDLHCEGCGEWQNAILGTAWELVGYNDDMVESDSTEGVLL